MFNFLILLVFIVFIALRFYPECYKKCPPNKAIVIFDKINNLTTPNIITQGGAFVIPITQDYALLSLEPMLIDINTSEIYKDGLLTKDAKRIDIKGNMTVAVSRQQHLLQIAAKHLLGMSQKDIIQLVKDIIIGEIRIVIATYSIEEIYNKTIEKGELKDSIKIALKNIGMELISMQIEEITDSSGYNESKERETSAENSFNQEFKEIAQKEIEKQDITEIQNMPDVPAAQNLQELQEVSEEESLENKIEEVQKTFELQNDTQTDANDIFASTRKYFENNGNT